MNLNLLPKIHVRYSKRFCEMSGKEKRGYKSRKLAEEAMYQTWRNPDGKYKPIRAYFCGKCACWHLTSQPKREKNIE